MDLIVQLEEGPKRAQADGASGYQDNNGDDDPSLRNGLKPFVGFLGCRTRGASSHGYHPNRASL